MHLLKYLFTADCAHIDYNSFFISFEWVPYFNKEVISYIEKSTKRGTPSKCIIYYRTIDFSSEVW